MHRGEVFGRDTHGCTQGGSSRRVWVSWKEASGYARTAIELSTECRPVKLEPVVLNSQRGGIQMTELVNTAAPLRPPSLEFLSHKANLVKVWLYYSVCDYTTIRLLPCPVVLLTHGSYLVNVWDHGRAGYQAQHGPLDLGGRCSRYADARPMHEVAMGHWG